jgi:hypothetical protein
LIYILIIFWPLRSYKRWTDRTHAHIPVVGEDESTVRAVPVDHVKYRHKAPTATAAATGGRSELKNKDQIGKEKKRVKKLQAKMKQGRSHNRQFSRKGKN